MRTGQSRSPGCLLFEGKVDEHAQALCSGRVHCHRTARRRAVGTAGRFTESKEPSPMDRIFGEIDRNRRCFFNMAAMTLAAAQFGLVRPASAQSKTTGPAAVNTGEYFPAFRLSLSDQAGTRPTFYERAFVR